MRYLALLVVIGACGDDRAADSDDFDDSDDYIDIGPDDDGSEDDDLSPDAFQSLCPGVPFPTPGDCDPLTQQPCRPNEKCAWAWDSLDDPSTESVEPTVGHLGCACAGAIPEGGACTRSGPTIGVDPIDVGTGPAVADDCERGSQCIGGICEAICEMSGAEPSCGSTGICTSHAGLFAPAGMEVAGTCGATCDPLTQVTDGDQLAACGSADPTAPVRGCYPVAAGSSELACNEVPYAARGLTDHEPALLRGTNACAAGYIPMVFDVDTDTVVRCHGLCAPADADNTMPELAVGDPSVPVKLPDQPAPRAGDGLCVDGKKGSATPSDCRYASTGEYGVCFPYGDYLHDHDGDPTTPPIPRPSCADLAPAAAAAEGCYRDQPFTRLRGLASTKSLAPHVLR